MTFMLIILGGAYDFLNAWLIELRISYLLIILEITTNCVFGLNFFEILIIKVKDRVYRIYISLGSVVHIFAS